MKKYLIGAIIVLVGLLGVCNWGWKKDREERDRLRDNQDALLSDVSYYKTEAGNNAASVQRLELTKSELEEHCRDLTETVADLNIKVKRLQSASTTVTQLDYKIITEVRDSIVYRDNPVTLQAFSFHDRWIDLNGVIDSGVFSGSISTRDTLVQVVHRVPKKFWFIRWGTKAIRQEVMSKNPHSNIIYTEYIEVKK